MLLVPGLSIRWYRSSVPVHKGIKCCINVVLNEGCEVMFTAFVDVCVIGLLCGSN